MGSADTAQLDRLQFKWENSNYLWYFAEPRLTIFFILIWILKLIEVLFYAKYSICEFYR